MKELKFWSKTFGDKRFERIYVTVNGLDHSDKLYIERRQNIIGGVKYGDDWTPVLKTDWLPAYAYLGVGSSFDAACKLIEDLKLDGKTFDEIKKMCE